MKNFRILFDKFIEYLSIYVNSLKFINLAFNYCFLLQKASEITAATAADIVSDVALSKIM